jgi:hypothetical protein
MTLKRFLFWFSVLVLAIVASNLIIDWIKNSKIVAKVKPCRECGYHAIEKDHQLQAA